MIDINLTEKELIHKKEKVYFIIAMLVSIPLYILLIISIAGFIWLATFLITMMFINMLMLGNIRINGVKLSPSQFPEVYARIVEIAGKMNMDRIPDIYVLESGGLLNAFATRFFGRSMVVLYSEIFELIKKDASGELDFVIAHELAHIKRRHITKQLLILPALWIPFLGSAYSRACEYTSDRYAAYYTGNSESAKNAMVILAIGKKLYQDVDKLQFIEQQDKEKGFIIWLSKKTSTHPPLPERIREIGILANEPEFSTRRDTGIPWLWVILTLLLFVIIGGLAITAIQKSDLFSGLDNLFPTNDIPIQQAVIERDTQQVQLLLESGADPDQEDQDGWTALDWAIQDNNTEIAALLLNNGADPNHPDHYKTTPFMRAAHSGYTELIEMLLNQGADPNLQDADGWTALTYAVDTNQIEAVELLAAAGADPEIADVWGVTPLMYAVQYGHKEISAILRR